MAKITITRPNGTVEYAELTTNKDLAGNDRLTVENAGVVYYAKLDSGVSTHMYVIQPNGRKLYVQKEVKFAWKYTSDYTWENASKMVIPRTGKYRLTFTVESIENNEETTKKEIKDDIFNQGDRFVKDGTYWRIKAKSGKWYSDYHFWDNGVFEEEPDYERIETTLESIEYIGEA